MTVIIPAWSRDALRLADTPVVKLAQLLMNNQEPVELLLLQQLPWLRYQLQTNQLTLLPWWNVFDDLQHVTQTTGLPLGIEDLDLPRGTQYVYIGDTVLLQREGQLKGTIHFHPAGFVSWVEITNDKQQRVVKVYDDRGFCSTQTTYGRHNARLETVWFTPDTQPIMRQNHEGQVALLDTAGNVTQTYPSMSAIITERVQQHLVERSDLLISDANPETATILTQLAQQHRLAYLLSTQMAPTLPDDLLAAVERVIVPTKQMVRKFNQVNADLGTPIDVISPYATTLALGHSTELPETTLVWAVNHLTINAQQTVVQQLVTWLVKDEENYLSVIATSKLTADKLVQRFQEAILAAADIQPDSPEAWFVGDILSRLQNNQPLDPGVELSDTVKNVIGQLQRVQINIRSQMMDQAREDLLGRARLLIDLGTMPDLQLQIGAISAGIPQVNATATGYVQDHQNGLIIAHPRDLTTALDFYLSALIHWNESLVKSIRSLEDLAEPKLLDYWREVIKNGDNA